MKIYFTNKNIHLKNIFLLETHVAWTTGHVNKIFTKSSVISHNK